MTSSTAINFDGSVTSSTATAAYVIRDQHVSFIQAGDKLLNRALISFVELIKAWLGLRAAISNSNATHILVEGDSAIAG